jgi:flagellar motor switch protein FliG
VTSAERPLKNDEKAAIVLFSLGPERAEQLLKRMDQAEHRRFAQAFYRLNDVSGPQIAAVLTEFTGRLADSRSLPAGAGEVREFLLRVLEPGAVDEIMADLGGAAGHDVWERLSALPEQRLASYLEPEKPQTVAVILSRLRGEKAARTLLLMPEERAQEIVLRLARLGRVDRDVMADLQLSLLHDVLGDDRADAGPQAYGAIASMFSEMPAERVAPLMALLEQESPEAAAVVHKVMFRFEDILTRVTAQALQVVIRNCQKDTLVLALRLAGQGNPKVVEYFMENMSKRAAEQLQEDMAGLGAVRIKEAQQAQAEIVRLIQELARTGEITLSAQGDEDPLLE